MMIPTGRPNAVAQIKGGEGFPQLRGTVRFYEKRGGVLVTAEVEGLTDGFHGFHIHEKGNCRGESFPETGGHYNPGKNKHPEHAGDLPPILSCGGKGYLAVWTNRFRVMDVLGRSVVIHALPDDLRSQPAGDSGEKIGCGVIRIMPASTGAWRQ